MSNQDSEKNPFVALFPSPDEAKKFNRISVVSDVKVKEPDSSIIVKHSGQEESPDKAHSSAREAYPIPENVEKQRISHILEEIFRFTLSNDSCCDKIGISSLVYLEEVYVSLGFNTTLDLECLQQALFERLVLEDPSSHIIVRGSLEDSKNIDASEKRILFYLYQSYYRLAKYKNLMRHLFEEIHAVIISQTAASLCHPEMFPESELSNELIELLIHYNGERGHSDVLSQFLVEVSTAIVSIEHCNLTKILHESFAVLQGKLMNICLIDRNLFVILDVLPYFTLSTSLCMSFLEYCTPEDIKNGRAFQNSLLGLPLGISCLPHSEQDQYEFFEQPSRYTAQEHNKTEENLWLPLGSVVNKIYQLFYAILCHSTDTKHKLLTWLGNCLEANSGRAKLWNSQLPEIFISVHASDGFLINLEAVLLKLCKPFAKPCSPKLLRVDPSYCSAQVVSDGNEKEHNIHFRGLTDETCLVPRCENMQLGKTTYNFSTECFFATHRSLSIGFHVAHEKMVKINQDLVRIQRVYEDARLQGGDSSEVVQRIKDNMEKGMTKFLSYRTALLEPETLDLMLNFHIATATWLINISTNDDLRNFKPVSFPLSESTSEYMSCIPEFVLENIADCIIFVRRFSPKSFEMTGDMLHHLMTLILVLMGSPERVKNPHLRANLAEMLEALMPPQDGEQTNMLIPSIYREKLFTAHPLATELVPTLLNVFVSIEMTGQSVAFEQKFQYRRPMYIVLNYIWNIGIHKKKMKELAENAEINIESSRPPLFLHFINLLVNDAIFLLDEALSCMSKLREMQHARDSGSWNSLPPNQYQQQEGSFHHLGLLAKFHNVMSNETINTLQWLTTEIKSIFCHPTMVERMAAMLNFFLLHLVGPQKKNLKVKDLKEYEFKPQELVRDICRIYQNLGSTEEPASETFCLAVSRDGRSYSPDLFPQAQRVLVKIGQCVLSSQLEEIAQTVQQLAIKQQKDEENLSESPEEFLDPIMNTIMRDPVILPSSGVTVDRATIARHLLSDQTDPFNRSPLTMDMVKTDENLKEKIQEWLKKNLNV